MSKRAKEAALYFAPEITLVLAVGVGALLLYYFGSSALKAALKKPAQMFDDAFTAMSEAARQPGSGEGAPYSPGDPYVY